MIVSKKFLIRIRCPISRDHLLAGRSKRRAIVCQCHYRNYLTWRIFSSFSAVWYNMQVPLITATIKNENKVLIIFHALCILCSLCFMLFEVRNIFEINESFRHRLSWSSSRSPSSISLLRFNLKSCWLCMRVHLPIGDTPFVTFFVIATLLIWYCCTFSNVLSFGSFILIVERATKEAK